MGESMGVNSKVDARRAHEWDPRHSDPPKAHYPAPRPTPLHQIAPNCTKLHQNIFMVGLAGRVSTLPPRLGSYQGERSASRPWLAAPEMAKERTDLPAIRCESE